jgi:hypothetical protein
VMDNRLDAHFGELPGWLFLRSGCSGFYFAVTLERELWPVSPSTAMTIQAASVVWLLLICGRRMVAKNSREPSGCCSLTISSAIRFRRRSGPSSSLGNDRATTARNGSRGTGRRSHQRGADAGPTARGCRFSLGKAARGAREHFPWGMRRGKGRGRLPRGTRRGGGGGAMRGRSGSGREIGSAEPRRYPAGAKGALSRGQRRRACIRTASSRRGE